MNVKIVIAAVLFAGLSLLAIGQEKEPKLESDVVFCIGRPDAYCDEFALAKNGYDAYPRLFPTGKIEYVVGKSKPATDWPFVHPAPMDRYWAKGEPVHPFTIKFDAKRNTEPLTLVVGYVATLDDRMSQTEITVNDTVLPTQVPKPVGHAEVVFQPSQRGNPGAMLFTVPAGTLKDGTNEITIRLLDKSWILYDYVALRKENKPLAMTVRPEIDLLTPFRAGPMKDVREIVFAVRAEGVDGHWYANFGYYADDENRLPFPTPGGKLCIYDLDSRSLRILLDDRDGAVRDPQVHYGGEKILFSYRPGGTTHYHLYEIGLDGGSLKRLTEGDCDDIEPTYTADGSIIFVSSRAKRWVQCWLTPVAILYACDADGKNVRQLSANVEHDNTPWPLPNGQILYTRWEYVDRSQVHYHHLWTMNPDGTRQMVFYGNMHPGTVFIDAKPIPGSEKIVASFSWGHGSREHAGTIGVIDPRNGPDDKLAARTISGESNYRDPWAFSEDAFMAAKDSRLILMDGEGREQIVYDLPPEWKAAKMRLHEPRPVLKRALEKTVGDTTDPAATTGSLVLVDVYQGRNMEGVERGEIKKLLILETLSKPINFTGGMEPMSYGGSFTLERIVGTVPVEEDGSAHFELPALRSFFFVALDEKDLAVKRMQSFVSVMPGESTACIGCHEERTATPLQVRKLPGASKRPPSPITPVADFCGIDAFGNKLAKSTGIPDVIDFPRDVQPILDAHCVACHNPDKRDGDVSLVGDRSPMYSISYYTITAKNLVADGRNLPKSNYPPRTLGSGASRLVALCDGSHYGTKLNDREKAVIRLWCDTGATYLGTCAGLGSGMVGGYAENRLDRQDLQWPEVQAMAKTLEENCAGCHTKEKNMMLPLSPSDEIVNPPWENMSPNDARRKYSRQLLYNLTRPEKSTLLLAPSAKSSGGYEACGKAILNGPDDPRYRTILTGIERTKRHLDDIKRFDMPGFVPRSQYVRELKKFGVLPPEHDPATWVDVYDLEQRYWRSLWYNPPTKEDPKQ